MFTFQDLYTRVQLNAGIDSGNSTEVQLSKDLVNQAHKYYAALENWEWTEDDFTFTTTSSQSTVKLPVDYRKVISFKLTVGTTDYVPKYIPDPVKFDEMNYAGSTVTSDYPIYYTVRKNRLYVYPTIATAGNTGTILYQKRPLDMTAAEYTTGTITTLANGSTTVTASGTTFTPAMVGRYLQITSDGQWYKIAGFTSTTVITLDLPYEGTSIAAGSETFVISEISLLPEEFQDLLWMRALGQYYTLKGDEQRLKFYTDECSLLLTEMKKKYASRTHIRVFEHGSDSEIRNANFIPRSITLTE